MRDFKQYTSSQLIEAIKESPHESGKERIMKNFEYNVRYKWTLAPFLGMPACKSILRWVGEPGRATWASP